MVSVESYGSWMHSSLPMKTCVAMIGTPNDAMAGVQNGSSVFTHPYRAGDTAELKTGAKNLQKQTWTRNADGFTGERALSHATGVPHLTNTPPPVTNASPYPQISTASI
jgi:hypothetical protein